MKKITLLTLVLSLCILTPLLMAQSGCEQQKSTADAQQRAATERSMQEANRQVGMPAIKNFQERKLVKQLFEIRDQEDLATYAYIVNLNGDLIYLGQCVGYGVPYSVQFTNPERVAHKETHGGGSFGTLPQPDPNGLFMPEGLSATWLMMLDEKTGEVRPVYVEPEIIVSPFALH